MHLCYEHRTAVPIKRAGEMNESYLSSILLFAKTALEKSKQSITLKVTFITLGSNNVHMWELGYGCQLVLWQWLCQHNKALS